MNRPALDRLQARNTFQGGRLARAVGANQAYELALPHRKIDALDGVDAAVGHFEPQQFQ